MCNSRHRVTDHNRRAAWAQPQGNCSPQPAETVCLLLPRPLAFFWQRLRLALLLPHFFLAARRRRAALPQRHVVATRLGGRGRPPVRAGALCVLAPRARALAAAKLVCKLQGGAAAAAECRRTRDARGRRCLQQTPPKTSSLSLCRSLSHSRSPALRGKLHCPQASAACQSWLTSTASRMVSMNDLLK